MAGAGYLKTLSLQLAAPNPNGAANLQALGAAGNLTLNGSLVSGGKATFDVARRVGITSIGNDTGINWTVTGTDRSGRAQSEVLQGAATGTAQTQHDFLTVSNVAGSGASANNVEVGTTGTASTAPYLVDYFATTANYNAIVSNPSGSVYNIEGCNDDLYPNLDETLANQNWVPVPNASGISTAGQIFIQGPFVMIRLTVISGTSLVTARFAFPLVGGGA